MHCGLTHPLPPETHVALTPPLYLIYNIRSLSFIYVISDIKMAWERYILKEMFLYDTYESCSTRKGRKRLWHKLQNVTLPHRETINRLVNT
jgi:hypothetical protein